MELKPKNTRKSAHFARVVIHVCAWAFSASARSYCKRTHARNVLHEAFVNLEAIHLKAVCMLL